MDHATYDIPPGKTQREGYIRRYTTWSSCLLRMFQACLEAFTYAHMWYLLPTHTYVATLIALFFPLDCFIFSLAYILSERLPWIQSKTEFSASVNQTCNF